MTDQTTDPILIPAALSPAVAEEMREETLKKLEAAKGSSDSLSLDIDGESLTPCAVQILVAASRTAERMGVSLELSEQGQMALSELQSH